MQTAIESNPFTSASFLHNNMFNYYGRLTLAINLALTPTTSEYKVIKILKDVILMSI
jgi:hypothetical protein